MGNEISKDGQKLNLWRQEAREGVHRIYRNSDIWPEIMATMALMSGRTARGECIGGFQPAPGAKPIPVNPKKAAHRAKVKAARKQKHGGKR